MSRFICILTAAMLVICAACAFGATSEIKYEKLGFSISLPRPFEKRLQSGSGAVISEVFVENGLGFTVTVIDAPPDSIASTAIEQFLQTAYKSAPKDGATRRWEMNSRQKELFKGISRTIEPGDKNVGIPYIDNLLNKQSGFMAVSMTVLGDESSPVLAVGVAGPADREIEIEAEAKGFAYAVKKFATKKEEKAVKAPEKPKDQPADITPVKMPEPPKAKVRPFPQKGQIELVGVIQSLDPKSSSLTILVDEVTEPGHGTAKLDPARPKLVFLRRLPKEAASGIRVLVIGKDTGVGKPIKARILEKVAGN